MWTYGNTTFRDPRRANTRLRLAGLIALLAALLTFIAVRFETKPHLTSAAANERAGRSYSRMWFDTADNLIGAFWQGNRLVVERWPGANPARVWRFDIAAENREQLLWTVAEDGSRLAWISGPSLHIQSASENSEPVSIVLPDRRVLALSLLSDASVAAVFEDGSVDRWEAASGRALGEWQAPMREIERGAADGNYLAFSSTREGKLALYNFHDRQWIQIQSFLSPERPERIVLAASGVEATLTEGRLRVGGVTRSSPGTIRSVASHLYDILAAGDFEGIFVLPPEGEYYRLARAAPGSLVACGQRGFAVSAAGETKLYTLGVENRLTSSGKRLSWAAALLMLMATALVFTPFVLWIMAVAMLALRVKLKRKLRNSGTRMLTEAPAELVKACASGETILWAGAGLSAQSGFPLRMNFIAGLLSAATLDEWADAALVRKLTGMCVAGKAEAAMNQLAAEIGEQRGAMISQYTATFDRPFSPPSESHKLLARLRLRSAVTTNYDVLLEQTDEQWLFNMATLGSERAAGRFLLKLYGNLQAPSTVLLSRDELKAALGGSNAGALRKTLSESPMLFVGCSLQGLLADLSMIGIPEGRARSRFAIAGVSNPSWEKEADELERKFGIEVLVSPADEIGRELPAFLDRLAQSVESMPEVADGAAAAAATAS